ncbi:MAG: hypothetical protein P9E24_11560 [Candidatus Competibacter sp.]|nr:hypothetical protein [Candidatus Competibacter sp.]
MHIAAMIIGIIGGLSLMGFAFLGHIIGSLGKSANIQILSLGIPVLAFVGAGVVMKNGIFGGILMFTSAGGIIYVFGNNTLGIFLSLLLMIGGLLGIFSGQREKSANTATKEYNRCNKNIVDIHQTTENKNIAGSTTAQFDQVKWNALLKYDNDIAAIANKIQPFGQKWLDEFALSYFALNDKQYLPEIERKILDSARKEAEENKQKAIAKAEAEAEAEKKEQLRILAEKQRKASEEQQKAYLEEQERRSQARKEQIKIWQSWVIKNRNMLAIGGFSVFFIGIILTVVLWQRNINIEEEARLAEERSQERIAREQTAERARIIAEERQKLDEAHRRTNQEQSAIPKSELPVKSVPAPIIQVGDSYIYESSNTGSPRPAITTKRTVTFNKDKIILSVLNISNVRGRWCINHLVC